ncbi:MAG: MBOAT family protein [Candidatus Omnitrophica bacterium]|nr:MBOAT family protein [Candidatus Omnitrophota bacterium]
MLFNSFSFLIFFPIVTASYFICPHRFRWALLLMASCVFYMWFVPQYIFILLLLIVIDYAMGLLIEQARLKNRYARRYLIMSIAATCVVWFIFKYFNFFSSNIWALAGFFGVQYPLKLIRFLLPIGLSFHTLQSLSYVIEVYRGRQKAERHFGIYALYVMFYPQLVAGPIERPYHLIPQLRQKHEVDYQRITDALKLMAWGMFKKVVIADRLKDLVDRVFDNPHEFQGPAFVIAAVLFAFQIYCDFSGYCDMAIGSAKAMGFRLTNNFRFPFFSRSIAEYWTRWNITFFSWVKDYVYVPLCQNQFLRDKRWIAVFLAFLFSGFWHGADWTYILAFLLLGIYVVCSRGTCEIRQKIYQMIGLDRNNIFVQLWQVLTCFFLFSFFSFFYRARSLDESFDIISRLPQGWGHAWDQGRIFSGFDQRWWLLTVELIAFLLIMDLLQENAGDEFVFAKSPAWVRWTYYYGLVLAMVFWGCYGQNRFLYFQF